MTMPDPTSDEEPLPLAEWLAVAVQAAQAPAPLLVDYFTRGRLAKENKRDGSPVTEADREAERIIRDRLARLSPKPYDILGEEHGLSGEGTRYRWVVDPIDGTRSFVRGIPLFGTIVALEDTVTHRSLVGVIYLPMLQATYAGARGLGSTCNGKPITVASGSTWQEAIVAIGDPLQFSAANCRAASQYLWDHCQCLRGYTDCFGHALVACGSVDVMMDPSLNPWDVLATQVLVEEAGGCVLLRPSAIPGRIDALFGNPALVHELASSLGF